MRTLLKNAFCLDFSKNVCLPKDLLIEEDRMVRVDEPAEISSGDLSIDLKGLYILPGLIDLHVHLCWDGSVDPTAHVRCPCARSRLPGETDPAGRGCPQSGQPTFGLQLSPALQVCERNLQSGGADLSGRGHESLRQLPFCKSPEPETGSWQVMESTHPCGSE